MKFMLIGDMIFHLRIIFQFVEANAHHHSEETKPTIEEAGISAVLWSTSTSCLQDYADSLGSAAARLIAKKETVEG